MLQNSVPKVLDLDLVAALDKLQSHLDRASRIGTLQLQIHGTNSRTNVTHSHATAHMHRRSSTASFMPFVRLTGLCTRTIKMSAYQTAIPDPKPQQPVVAGLESLLVAVQQRRFGSRC